MDFDLWRKLRGPALVGRHPLNLKDIWEYFATNDIKKTRLDGTPNYLAMPTPYEKAQRRFNRAVIVSALLPLSGELFERYANTIVRREPAPYDAYCKAWAETNQLLDEAIAKVAMELHGPDRAVVPMTSGMAREISEKAVAPIYRGDYHGPCKGGHWPQRSIGVLTGLVQFGISRAVFRDESRNGQVTRFIGPLRSIVLFDTQDPITDGTDGVVHLCEDWRERLISLTDFTDTRAEVNRQRYCTYIPDEEWGEQGCGLCVEYCPSGAVGNSAPRPDGDYSKTLKEQVSRFSNDHLQFDFARCLEDRSQKAKLYADYVCARCVAVCASRGTRRTSSANR